MEQKMPTLTKRFLKFVRIAYFMLRKGVSKGKILSDLSLLMRRGSKLAGKLEAIHNLMFHHHSSSSSSSTTAADADNCHISFPTPQNEYEFSCSNTPAHPIFHLPFHLSKRKHSKAAAEAIDGELMAQALEMISSAAASPVLPGFGRSPFVRQLRITDSPFPLTEIEEDNQVDEAAEKFITKFYKQLKQQNSHS